MIRRLVLALGLLAVAPGLVWGHPMPNSMVVLRLHRESITADITLPLVELAIGWDKPLPTDAVQAVRDFGPALSGYLGAHVRAASPDGRPWTVAVGAITPLPGTNPDLRVALTLSPPPGAPVDRLTLHYDAILHHLVTHSALVSLAGDWRNGVLGAEPVVLGTLRDGETTLLIDRSGGTWGRGFAAMVRLGMQHIAEGTDHLLFLLALILPAPLVAQGWRWGGPAGSRVAVGRVAAIVSAFTLGHSLTLALGALGLARLPEAPIEVAIAGSILVSAVHALVPIFRGREVAIAGGFGLIHGLAFAATLADLDLDPWTLASSILGFNLGIEVFQLGVILSALPWLILLARSRLYQPLRVAGALSTGVAALAWLADRVTGRANPVVPIVEAAAAHALLLLAGLIVLALGATAVGSASRRRGEAQAAAGSTESGAERLASCGPTGADLC